MADKELVGLSIIGAVMIGVVLFWSDISKKLDLMYWYNKLPEYQFRGLPDVSSEAEFIEKYGETVREYLQGTYQEYEQHLKDASEKAAETVFEAVKKATEKIESGIETVEKVTKDIQETVSYAEYPEREEDLIEKATKAAEEVANKIKDTVDDVVDTIVKKTGGSGGRYR